MPAWGWWGGAAEGADGAGAPELALPVTAPIPAARAGLLARERKNTIEATRKENNRGKKNARTPWSRTPPM